MPSLSIHRNDTVKVLTGADRGKTGRVLRVFPDKGTVLVEHVRVVKKTVSSKQWPADQGRHRRAGVADQRVQCGAGLSQLRRGARGLTSRGRHARAGLQEVRAGTAHEEVREAAIGCWLFAFGYSCSVDGLGRIEMEQKPAARS